MVIETNIPEWMRHPDKKARRVDSDIFIKKSLRALTALLTTFQRTVSLDAVSPGRAAIRIFSTLLFLVLVSVSHKPGFVAVCLTGLLLFLATQRIRIVLFALKNAVIAGLFAGAILIPSMMFGNAANSILFCMKTFCMVTAVSLLVAETRWESLFSALSLFRVPDILILILDITLRYIFILGESAHDLMLSLKLRSVGRNPSKRHSLSRIAGTLFLRSTEAAKHLQQAMECRCFSGTYSVKRKLHFSGESVILIMIDIIFFIIFLWSR